MTSQTGQQIINIYVLPYISRSKDNQTIKFGQLKYSVKNVWNHAKNEVERLVPDLFLFFEKALWKVKVSGQQLSFNIFW